MKQLQGLLACMAILLFPGCSTDRNAPPPVDPTPAAAFPDQESDQQPSPPAVPAGTGLQQDAAADTPLVVGAADQPITSTVGRIEDILEAVPKEGQTTATAKFNVLTEQLVAVTEVARETDISGLRPMLLEHTRAAMDYFRQERAEDEIVFKSVTALEPELLAALDEATTAAPVSREQRTEALQRARALVEQMNSIVPPADPPAEP